MKKDPKKIIIQKNKAISRLQCPICQTSFLKSLTTVETMCTVCNKNVNAFVSVDSFNFYAPMILKKLRSENTVVLNVSDYNLNALQSIIYFFEGLDLDIGKIERKEISIEKAECNACGLCNNCVECDNCKSHFVFVEHKGVCPKCGSKKFNKSFIKKFDKQLFDEKIEKPICPYCKSFNVKKTWFDKKLKKCPRCGANKTTKRRKIEINEVVFSKKPRNVV